MFFVIQLHLPALHTTVLCQQCVWYIYTYKSLLKKYYVNNVSYNTYALTSLCYHSTVSIRFLSVPLHLQVFATTVLCQYFFINYLYTHTSSLPQYCVNNVSYNRLAYTSLCYHSTVSVTFLTIHLHFAISVLYTYVSWNTTILTSLSYDSIMSIVFVIHLHLRVFAKKVLFPQCFWYIYSKINKKTVISIFYHSTV